MKITNVASKPIAWSRRIWTGLLPLTKGKSLSKIQLKTILSKRAVSEINTETIPIELSGLLSSNIPIIKVKKMAKNSKIQACKIRSLMDLTVAIVIF